MKKKTRADLLTRFQKGHGGFSGDKNGFWKGDDAGYHAIHQWLRANFGRADTCENKKCVYPRKNRGNKTIHAPSGYEWALKHGMLYTHTRENFIRLCASCHKKYDQKIEEIDY